ncbi:ExeM/NucH family extracellular endonuclease [Trueperella sp.]|uniref:ExeM/NucH family extracellular endonuclease n=1 Tax=Trueperella sp. TaxID=2699835 RepID=UPI003735CBAD
MAIPLAALPAQAAPDGSNVVINEVYVHGGSKAGIYRDYVELYNPTEAPIDLNGMSLQYFSSSGTGGNGTTALTGTVAPGGYYLVYGGTNDNDADATDLIVDATGSMNMSASNGSVVLFNVQDRQTVSNPVDTTTLDTVVDAFGWGSAGIKETASFGTSTAAGESYQRAVEGVDTDNNSVDFTNAAPTPMYSGGSALEESTDPGEDPTDPGEDPTTPPAGEITPIADIQGTGAATPLNGQTVTTEGYVTAVYATGGFNGFYLQTEGTGGTHDGEASHGIFVYAGNNSALASLEKGQFLRVTGTAGEYNGLTQLTNPTWTAEEAPETAVAPVPVTIDVLPDGDAAREKYEGMLIAIEGDYTITDNYNTNRYGELGLAPGLEPLLQPSQVYNPTENPAEIAALDEHNKNARVNLDDGMSWDLTRFNQNNDLIPVAYLNVNDPARVGAQVDFLQPMVLDYRNNSWKIQPTEPINLPGADDPANYVDNTDQWVDFLNNERPAAPADLGSDVTLATFNVLNYFTTTGEDVACRGGYPDRDGVYVTANNCDPRGAYHADDLQRQEQKIVAAINELDATVVGLEEIENSVHFNKDRDQALNDLVAALNADAEYTKWAAVPSPTNVPANEDVIRLAYIYQPDVVQPVGESKILIGHEAITGTAREPLAQEFERVDGTGETFVAVVNHFKSKGSLTNPGDEDYYQGNNNRLRVEQAKATRAWVEAEYPGKSIFIIGDLNSYGAEDPILEFTNNGYTDTTTETGKYTYQFGGLVGSLDHVLANETAMDLVTGVDIWEINGDEPIAFEYSRYNYNVKVNDLYDDGPFRSSDHDPVIVGIDLPKDSPEIPEQPEADVEYGEWTDTTVNVEDRTVNQERTVTTTEYVWNAEAFEWELGEPVETIETQTRPMTQEEIDELLPPAPVCEVMDRPTVLAGATGRFGEATGDVYADVWAVNGDGELHFYKGYRSGIAHQGIVGCDVQVTSLTKISDVNGDRRADFIGRHADGSMNFYYSTGDGFLRPGGKVGHGWNGMDNIIYAGQLGAGSDEYVVARQVATGDLYRYKLTPSGLSGTTKIGHGWGGMSNILSVGNLVGSGNSDLIGITDDGRMIAYEGLRDGTVKTHGQIGHGWTSFDQVFVPGDLTADSRFDLVGVRGDGKMFRYANGGNGWFTPAVQIGHGWTSMEMIN